jgi:hypothetical protein
VPVRSSFPEATPHLVAVWAAWTRVFVPARAARALVALWRLFIDVRDRQDQLRARVPRQPGLDLDLADGPTARFVLLQCAAKGFCAQVVGNAGEL